MCTAQHNQERNYTPTIYQKKKKKSKKNEQNSVQHGGAQTQQKKQKKLLEIQKGDLSHERLSHQGGVVKEEKIGGRRREQNTKKKREVFEKVHKKKKTLHRYIGEAHILPRWGYRTPPPEHFIFFDTRFSHEGVLLNISFVQKRWDDFFLSNLYLCLALLWILFSSSV